MDIKESEGNSHIGFVRKDRTVVITVVLTLDEQTRETPNDVVLDVASDQLAREASLWREREMLTCEHCGVKFRATRSDARFHSAKCRAAAHRELRRHQPIDIEDAMEWTASQEQQGA